jgi:hypothetical protein
LPRDSRRFVAAIAILVGANVLWYGSRHTRAPAPETPGPVAAWLPDRVGVWAGQETPVDPFYREYLQAEAIVHKTYRSPRGTLDATVVVATSWRAVHSPLGCFPSGGWAVTSQRHLVLPVPPGASLSLLPVQEVTAVKGNRSVAAVWTFIGPGGATDNWVRQCWAMARAGPGKRGMLLLLEAPADPSGGAPDDLANLAVQLYEPLAEALRAE